MSHPFDLWQRIQVRSPLIFVDKLRALYFCLSLLLNVTLSGCSLLIDLECEGDIGCGQVETVNAGTQSGDPAGDPAGELAGDIAGNIAGIPAGDLAGDPAGDPAGDLAGDLAGQDLVNPSGERPPPPDLPYHEQECVESCEVEWTKIFNKAMFEVGSDIALSDDERPARMIAVNSFEASPHEITVGQYSRCVRAGGCPTPTSLDEISSLEDPSLGALETRPPRCTYFEAESWSKPMNCITYCEALNFVHWLSIDQVGWRLLSESEWYYIALDEGRSTYPWGDEVASCDRAHLYQCEPIGPRPTCSIPPSESQVSQTCDLIGNLREWVADAYQPNYESAPEDQGAVLFEEEVCGEMGVTLPGFEMTLGVTKGGDWRSTASAARPSNRFPTPLELRSDQIGFRIARPIGF